MLKAHPGLGGWLGGSRHLFAAVAIQLGTAAAGSFQLTRRRGDAGLSGTAALILKPVARDRVRVVLGKAGQVSARWRCGRAVLIVARGHSPPADQLSLGPSTNRGVGLDRRRSSSSLSDQTKKGRSPTEGKPVKVAVCRRAAQSSDGYRRTVWTSTIPGRRLLSRNRIHSIEEGARRWAQQYGRGTHFGDGSCSTTRGRNETKVTSDGEQELTTPDQGRAGPPAERGPPPRATRRRNTTSADRFRLQRHKRAAPGVRHSSSTNRPRAARRARGRADAGRLINRGTEDGTSGA